MRILFCIKSLNVSGGGAEKVLVQVANGLCARGHDIHVLTFDLPGTEFYPLNPDIPKFNMGFTPPGASTSLFGFLFAIPRIRRVVRKLAPDISVAFMHSTYVPFAIATLGQHLKLVASEHTEARHYESRPLQNWLRKIAERLSVLRTVPSKAVRDGYDGYSSIRTVVIPNPVQLSDLCESDPASIQTVVLSIGRLMQEKDHAILIDAFSQIANKFPAWRLRLVGDGPLRRQLENQVAELGLEKQIEIAGFTHDVAKAYAAARFVVLPSRYESFSMTAAEALLSKRAVLGFDDCAGIKELVNSGHNGLLVAGYQDRTDRVNALVEGLKQLMEDKGLCLRLGNNGPPSVSRFKPDEILNLWEKLLVEASMSNASISNYAGTDRI